MALVGIAWTAATHFVVPVLVIEKLGPFAALKRSSEILVRAWGESVVAGFSLGLLDFLLALPGILAFPAATAVWMATQSLALAAAVAGLGILYLLLVSVILSAVRQVFIAAAYLYAAEGAVPSAYSEETLGGAFRSKK